MSKMEAVSKMMTAHHKIHTPLQEKATIPIHVYKEDYEIFLKLKRSRNEPNKDTFSKIFSTKSLPSDRSIDRSVTIEDEDISVNVKKKPPAPTFDNKSSTQLKTRQEREDPNRIKASIRMDRSFHRLIKHFCIDMEETMANISKMALENYFVQVLTNMGYNEVEIDEIIVQRRGVFFRENV